ncbi:MAG: nucleoside triphosphate pyrophosphohydrolase [Victivallales bacterium]|nr:nucleoside triphosphate pyrophosphohydrolase [Victivallales bacterium]
MPEIKHKNIDRLVEILRHLRSPEGCPWDRKQSHESLKPLMIDEAAELLDAIDNHDAANLKEELGDLLMHIVFHSLIAEENNEFDFDDVAAEVSEKMLRRHPHIFSDHHKPDTAEEVVSLWKEIKAEENKDKKRKTEFDRIPANLPPLKRAEKVQKKAAELGFDWRNIDEVIDKLEEEIAELKEALAKNNNKEVEDELGDVLFSVVNICRFRQKTEADEILHKTIDKFIRRFKYIEEEIAGQYKKFHDYDIEQLEEIWQKAKKNV